MTDEAMGTQDNNDISPTVPVEHARPGFIPPDSCVLTICRMTYPYCRKTWWPIISLAWLVFYSPLRYATNLCLSMLNCLTFSITMNYSKCGIDTQPCCHFTSKRNDQYIWQCAVMCKPSTSTVQSNHINVWLHAPPLKNAATADK